MRKRTNQEVESEPEPETEPEEVDEPVFAGLTEKELKSILERATRVDSLEEQIRKAKRQDRRTSRDSERDSITQADAECARRNG